MLKRGKRWIWISSNSWNTLFLLLKMGGLSIQIVLIYWLHCSKLVFAGKGFMTDPWSFGCCSVSVLTSHCCPIVDYHFLNTKTTEFSPVHMKRHFSNYESMGALEHYLTNWTWQRMNLSLLSDFRFWLFLMKCVFPCFDLSCFRRLSWILGVLLDKYSTYRNSIYLFKIIILSE